MKSADWSGNTPFRLAAWSAAELAKLPRYYVMDLDRTMAETVAPEMPSAADIANCRWLFSGRTIDVPACFIGGASDWGVYQRPGRLEAMQTTACTRFHGVHLVPGAAHWVQQEQPEAMNVLLLGFLKDQPPPDRR